MINYIQWFLDGIQNVRELAIDDIATIWVVLCCAIPIILTLAGVVSLIWAFFGLFGGRRK